MSGSLLAIIIIPVAVAIALACWIISVYHANRHPETGAGGTPPHEVSGGTFQAAGGRQVTPRRDETPGEAAEYPDRSGSA